MKKKTLALAVACTLAAGVAFALPNGSGGGCNVDPAVVWTVQWHETSSSCDDANQCDQQANPNACRQQCGYIADAAADYFANQAWNWCTLGTASNYCSPSSPYC